MMFLFFAVADCKARWKSLRDYANRAKNKPTGSQADNRSSSSELLCRLNFLEEAKHHRKTVSNIVSVSPSPPLFDESLQKDSDDDHFYEPEEDSAGDMASPSNGQSYKRFRGEKEMEDSNDTKNKKINMVSISTGRSKKRCRAEREFEDFIHTQNKPFSNQWRFQRENYQHHCKSESNVIFQNWSGMQRTRTITCST